MTKKEHIAYWLKTANEDWKTVNYLLKGKRFVNTLFFAHLVLEKLCKAHWVKDNVGNHPPKIHNLIYLIDNTKLKVDSEQRQLLEKMNVFQLEGRYPDYTNTLYKMCDKKFTEETIKQANTLRLWLLNSL